MKKLITLFAVLGFLSAAAQSGAIKGIVTDESREVVPFANVMALQEGNQILGTTTDFDGKYVLKPLDSGLYVIKVSFVGYETKKIVNVNVSSDKITDLKVQISQGVDLSEVIIQYEKPVFEKDHVTAGYATTSREEIRQMAARSVSDIAKTTGGGITARDNGSNATNVRGARSGASVTFIDGIKVIGTTSLPNTSIEEVRVKIGGLSAQYGDEETAAKQSEEEFFNKPTLKYTQPTHVYSRQRVYSNDEKKDVNLYREEDYQEIADNEFERVFDAPLSTFSVDVDKASYANMRRYINDGYLPPQSAIRIEELINYFDYDYPQPEDEHPISITTELAECPWNADRKLALIGIQGKEINMAKAPASNLVFLIDVSGSMYSADKLDLLKNGLRMLTNELREEDRIAIVVYAGAAGVVLNSTSGANKQKIKGVLNSLSAGGSTAGGAGIKMAYKIAEKHFIKGGNNRIILASDGDFNVGVSNQDELVKMIEEKRESGVFLSVLGFGTGNLRDQVMEQIADHGNGNYNYIDNILEAKKVLVKEMGGTLFTIAKDVKVQTEFNPAIVKSYRLVGYVNRLLEDKDFNDDRKDAGDMGAGHTVTAMYEIILVGSAEHPSGKDVDDLKYQAKKTVVVEEQFADELLTVKFRYKQPDADESVLMSKVLKNESVSLVHASENFRFSAAVASFGMKLRDSESVSNLSYKDVLKLATEAKGEDNEGYRAEFIRLVETTDLMK